jgi:allantoicase
MTDKPDFTDHFDLASEKLGGAVIASNDDFFAEKENLLKPHAAVWKEHEYTDRGKWMDGWESRRKRIHGDQPDAHDWALVRLGVPGIVRGVVVDTSFFRGNYPDACSIEGCAAPTDAFESTLLDESVTTWTEILPRTKLEGNSKNAFAIASNAAFTHLRLRIFPDGGVARLRVHGDVVPDWRRIGHARGEIDLAAIEHGGDVLLASDMFFGERRNLIMPGRAINMSDGWETRRRRGPGHDWAILRLGASAAVRRIEVDTNHFKGNFPDTCTLEVAYAPDASVEELAKEESWWKPLLARTKLQAHTRHRFEAELEEPGPATHVRLRVYPDGGVSRLRVFGVLDEDQRRALAVRRLDALPEPDARAELHACVASRSWVDGMLAARPFGTAARVRAAATSAWDAVKAAAWKEALAAHPRIGEKTAEAGPERAAVAKSWSKQEQSGMATATPEQKAAIAAGNQAYEAKHGFIYLVCATGKSADELLAIQKARLDASADAEAVTVADELGKIMAIRVEKLLDL